MTSDHGTRGPKTYTFDEATELANNYASVLRQGSIIRISDVGPAPGTVHTFNGTSWVAEPSASESIYDIVLSIEGKPTASATVLVFAPPRQLLFPSNFAGSIARAIEAPTDNAIFSILNNGIEIGQIQFLAGNANGLFSS